MCKTMSNCHGSKHDKTGDRFMGNFSKNLAVSLETFNAVPKIFPATVRTFCSEERELWALGRTFGACVLRSFETMHAETFHRTSGASEWSSQKGLCLAPNLSFGWHMAVSVSGWVARMRVPRGAAVTCKDWGLRLTAARGSNDHFSCRD